MKVAIVTGAAGRGIGRSTALTLSRDGFSVVVNYRSSKASAENICSLIKKNGGLAMPVQADIFTKEGCDTLVNATISSLSRIDACIIGPGADWNPEEPDRINPKKSIKDVVQEIQPIYNLIPRLIPEMAKTGDGRIIGIGSNPDLPSPSYSYNVAKNCRIDALGGLVDFCWKKHITVNIIAPGPVDQFSDEQSAIQELNRLGSTTKKINPQDIAEIISFLCSDKGRYLTGNVIGYYF